jgi:hypothetical protein
MTLGTEAVRKAIKQVLQDLGWKFLADQDTGHEEVVALFGAQELGNWVMISRILDDKNELLVMATTQENVPENRRKHAVEFITRANFGILNGFFDMDLDDGDCRFSSRVQYAHTDEEQLKWNFKKTFTIVHGTFSKYLPGIHAVVHKQMNGKEAVEVVEGGTGIIPDASERPLLAAAAKHLSDAKTSFICHPQKGYIRLPCSVQGITLQLRIKAAEESKNLYVFASYPKNNGKIPLECMHDELIEYICRVNWGLPFGYFDLDVVEGELKYVTWINTEYFDLEYVRNNIIKILIIACITTFVKYFVGLEEVIHGTKSAKEAISVIETSKKEVPDLIQSSSINIPPIEEEDDHLQTALPKGSENVLDLSSKFFNMPESEKANLAGFMNSCNEFISFFILNIFRL